MTNLIIPLRFGTVAEGRLSSQVSTFHTELLRLHGFDSDVHKNITTLPVSINYEHTVSPDGVADEIKRLSELHECDVLLLDVGGPDEREVCRPNIIRGIANAIFLLSEAPRFSKIILFFAVSISEKDVASKFLYPIASTHHVSIIFGDGTGYEIPLERINEFKTRIPQIVESATADVVEKLKKKLVRHVGYFRFEHNNEIVPHFFDGSECEDEVYQIVYSRMLKDNFSSYATVYYDARTSKWFERPFIEAAKAANLESKIQSFDNLSHAGTLLEKNACLYMPIIRTGATVRNIGSKVIGLLPGNETLFYSLLATHGGRPKNGRLTIPIVSQSGQEFNIDTSYDVMVPDIAGNIQRVWKEFNAPDIFKPANHTLKLSSCAAWGMFLEAGLVEEQYKSKARDFLGYIPNSARLAELNGPFIAKKLSTILSTKYGVIDGQNLVFVCPNETHALRIRKIFARVDRLLIYSGFEGRN